eukprot:6197605-Pleurochrysis_carterae.AAC.1
MSVSCEGLLPRLLSTKKDYDWHRTLSQAQNASANSRSATGWGGFYAVLKSDKMQEVLALRAAKQQHNVTILGIISPR